MKSSIKMAVIVLVAFFVLLGPASSEVMTREQYQAKTIALFKEIMTLKSTGYFHLNNYGFGAANKEAHDWYQRMDAFVREAEVPYTKEFPLKGGITLPGTDLVIFAAHLHKIKSDILTALRLEVDFLSGRLLRTSFWLATICVENKRICDKYIDK